MIPVTEHTAKAIAALIYNHAYDQDVGAGWEAKDKHSGPGNSDTWLEWAS